jgi:hypothetical protein
MDTLRVIVSTLENIMLQDLIQTGEDDDLRKHGRHQRENDYSRI